MTKREQVYKKFDGFCAYSGIRLKDDWQIDHIIPKSLTLQKYHRIIHHDDISNLMPVQRIINHYKRSLSLEQFRTWYLSGLHERLKKLPKKTKDPKAIKRKEYLLEVAELFGITENKPFDGKFYFEKLKEENEDNIPNKRQNQRTISKL